ncbi:MAG: acyl-CoA dehydrogenase family protein, partial [Rhodococcus qingshengii]
MRRTLYGPDHEAFRESAREFVNRNILPVAEKLIDQRFIDREIWLEAGRNGFLGLEVPEAYGGSEAGDYRFNAVLAEELSRASAAVASSFGIHADVVAPYLVQLTTEEQKQRWLPKFCTGEMLTAIGMTEPSGGSDLASLKTTAVKDGDDWIINGSKTFITNGYNADLVIVAARTSPEKKSKGITLFAVETGMEGFERGRKLDKVGQHESDTAELFFENVRVPSTNIIGEIDRGFIHMMEMLPQERVGAAVSNIAHAAPILEETLQY